MPTVRLTELAAAIADRRPIDWDEVAASHPELTPDLATRIRIVERIAQAHANPAVAASDHRVDSSSASDQSPDDDEEVPFTWGPLTVVEKIGRGGFGDVYRALDPRLDRSVALKLLRRRDPHASTVVDEGHLMARVRHTNVITVHGAECIDGRVGLWMEFVKGRTLEQELQSRGLFPSDEIVRIGIDLSRALRAVHGAGLLHRDVKAQNVLRDADGRIVLTDFGAGREVGDGDSPSGRELAGTPLYLAPEVLKGGLSSRASDIYSLGVLLYHLATGSFPVRGRSFRDLRDAHACDQRTPLKAGNPRVPKRLAIAVGRALEPDPAQRYATAGEFEAALLACTRPRVVRRHLWSATAVGLAILSAAGLGAWRWSRSSAAARLGFRPHDLVLITRFENRTGESVFDGALEYALERELGNSDVVGLVPADRVDDTLTLMKRPLGTVVDRTVGREIAIRDGHVKAILAGRIEKFVDKYLLTAQLVDPADAAVVATLSEEAVGSGGVLRALQREAANVRLALGERRDRIRGVNQENEPVSTPSLRAFKLYQESFLFGRQARWPAARDLARQAVAEDPEFATGWIQLAWAVVGAAGGNTVGALRAERFRGVREEIRPFLVRAYGLANGTPEWERCWILGSYYSLSLDPERAIPFYEYLLRLRPDHPWAAGNLAAAFLVLDRRDQLLRVQRILADQRPNAILLNYDAATRIVDQTRDLRAAQPYLERIRGLLPPEGDEKEPYRRAWLEWLPAYAAWELGDIGQVSTLLEQAKAGLSSRPPGVQKAHAHAISTFSMALGQFHEAVRYDLQGLEIGVDPVWETVVLAVMQDDVPELRRILPSIPPAVFNNRGPGPRIFPLMRAGLFDQAREVLKAAAATGLNGEGLLAFARGDLSLSDGRADEAIPLLTQAVTGLKSKRFEYYLACESLATALKRASRPAEALAALEVCGSERPRYDSVNFNRPPCWMYLRLRLADEYRAVNRVPEAEKIEGELRKLLAYADLDNRLLQRLSSR